MSLAWGLFFYRKVPALTAINGVLCAALLLPSSGDEVAVRSSLVACFAMRSKW